VAATATSQALSGMLAVRPCVGAAIRQMCRHAAAGTVVVDQPGNGRRCLCGLVLMSTSITCLLHHFGCIYCASCCISSHHHHHHHQITKLSHSINAIGPAPHRSGRKREHRSIVFATIIITCSCQLWALLVYAASHMLWRSAGVAVFF
jgi:hypothetical protein